jgi:hypothetical protein
VELVVEDLVVVEPEHLQPLLVLEIPHQLPHHKVIMVELDQQILLLVKVEVVVEQVPLVVPEVALSTLEYLVMVEMVYYLPFLDQQFIMQEVDLVVVGVLDLLLQVV